ncbi:MAG: hypothetical protein P8J32_05090 [bacterium]|nr:hypothetical protein [bacterium]
MSNLVNFNADQLSILIESRASHDADKRKLEACEKDFIRQGLRIFTGDSETARRDAETLLVAYWNASAEIGRTASVRNQFSKVAKADFEHVFNGDGVNVTDNKITIAKARKIEKSPLELLAAELVKMSKDGMPTDAQTRLCNIFAQSVQASES